MKHDDMNSLLLLRHYGELSPAESRKLEDHLVQCAECRQEAADLERFAMLVSAGVPGADDELVAGAHRSLMRQIEDRQEAEVAARHRSRAPWWSLRWSSWPSPAWAGVAASMAGLGFLIGYLVFGSPRAVEEMVVNPYRDPDVRITGVRFERKDPESSDVLLSFHMTRRVVLESTLESPEIQRLLAYALIAEDNPGVRLQAVSAFLQRAPVDQEAITALVSALRTDPNPAVRRQALAALRSYEITPQIKSALVDALLSDRNARIRIEAIEALSEAADSGLTLDAGVLDQLGRQLSHDENSYVRRRGQSFLEQIGYSVN